MLNERRGYGAMHQQRPGFLWDIFFKKIGIVIEDRDWRVGQKTKKKLFSSLFVPFFAGFAFCHF
ncbi:MAG: hypothetical protein IKX31_10550 [Muribaculaceae bacterium]|nr:hypothetical protein [Muribaculaceae bacterium]